jgi:hypothetical protein
MAAMGWEAGWAAWHVQTCMGGWRAVVGKGEGRGDVLMCREPGVEGGAQI